jgi:hypothetical protein
MKNGKCPKCGSGNIYKSDSAIVYEENSLPQIILSTADGWRYFDYDSYVCTDCGYFENYIRPEKDIKGDSLFEIVEQDSEWERQ